MTIFTAALPNPAETSRSICSQPVIILQWSLCHLCTDLNSVVFLLFLIICKRAAVAGKKLTSIKGKLIRNPALFVTLMEVCSAFGLGSCRSEPNWTATNVLKY